MRPCNWIVVYVFNSLLALSTNNRMSSLVPDTFASILTVLMEFLPRQFVGKGRVPHCLWVTTVSLNTYLKTRTKAHAYVGQHKWRNFWISMALIILSCFQMTFLHFLWIMWWTSTCESAWPGLALISTISSCALSGIPNLWCSLTGGQINSQI